jgi:hypothetical protein
MPAVAPSHFARSRYQWPPKADISERLKPSMFLLIDGSVYTLY